VEIELKFDVYFHAVHFYVVALKDFKELNTTSRLLGCYVLSTGKHLTDVSKESSAFVFRDEQSKNLSLNISALRSFETSISVYRWKWCNVLEGLNLHVHRCFSLKCREVEANKT
jgi:hypothetical protein